MPYQTTFLTMMGIFPLFIANVVCFVILSGQASAFQPTDAAKTRRATLEGLVTAIVVGSGVTPALALGGAKENYSPFIGETFTDPINHPGGTRTIERTGTSFAGYSLVTVKGGGGKGEPTSYELPGMVFDCPGTRTSKYCISIDFSPKGGPKDFQGYWDEEKKGIRFVLDNNFWPTR